MEIDNDSHIDNVLGVLNTVPQEVEGLIYSPNSPGGTIKAYRHAIAYPFDFVSILHSIDKRGVNDYVNELTYSAHLNYPGHIFSALLRYCFGTESSPADIYKFGLWHHQMMAAFYYATGAPLLKRGEDGYFPIGNYPEMDKLFAHYNLGVDFFKGMEKIILDSRIKFILVGNECSFFNACRHLGVHNAVTCYTKGAEGDPEYTKDYQRARAFAKVVGVRDQISIHSAQEVIFNHREFVQAALEKEGKNSVADLQFSDFYKPPILMDEVVDGHPKMRQLFGILTQITEQDDTFADMLWKRVPSEVRIDHFKRHGGSPDRARSKGYKRLNLNEQAVAREIMGYPLMQTAFALYWGAIKFGHSKGEAGFDALAIYCLENHFDKIEPYMPNKPVQFSYLDREAGGFTEAGVMYRGHAYEASATKIELISIARFPENKSAGHFSNFILNFLPQVNSSLLNIKLNRALNSFQKEMLISAEIIKFLRELRDFLLNYNDNFSKEFNEAFEKSGLNLFFQGGCHIFDLQKHNQLPFTVEIISRDVLQCISDAGLKEGKLPEFKRDQYGNKLPLTAEAIEATILQSKLNAYARSNAVAKERIDLQSKIEEEYGKRMPPNLTACFNAEGQIDDYLFKLNFAEDILRVMNPDEGTEMGASYLIRYMGTALRPILEIFHDHVEFGHVIEGILGLLLDKIYPGLSLHAALGKRH